MSDLEAMMWRAEADPRLRSTGVVVDVLDHAPDWERLVDAHAWAVQLIPRLEQRVVEDPLRLGAPAWARAREFDLEYHLRRVRVPEPGTLEQLLTIAEGLAMTPFDRARPPWEAVLVEGLAGGGAAYVLKLHHCLADGQASVQLFDLVHARTAEHTPDKPIHPEGDPLTTGSERLAQRAGAVLDDGWRLARWALFTAADAARHPDAKLAAGARFARSLVKLAGPPPAPPSVLMAERSLARRYGVIAVPLQWLRAAAKEAGGSVNDAYLAALVGGLRIYHEAHELAPAELPIAFPVSLRGDDDPLGGNRFAGARIAGPVAERRPRDRIRLIREQVLAARDEPALDFMGFLAPVLARAPARLLARVTVEVTRSIDLQASNFPGLARPAYIAGSRIERMYCFGAIPGPGAMATLISHEGMCCVAVTTDAAAVPDHDRFLDCLRAGFDEVLGLVDRRLADVEPVA
jgi:WS/DGAT/MGAT family acyltransferase